MALPQVAEPNKKKDAWNRELNPGGRDEAAVAASDLEISEVVVQLLEPGATTTAAAAAAAWAPAPLLHSLPCCICCPAAFPLVLHLLPCCICFPAAFAALLHLLLMFYQAAYVCAAFASTCFEL